MRPFENKEEAYNWCIREGNIIFQEESNEERARANLQIADEYLKNAKNCAAQKSWNTAYTLFYDSLHLLVEALLILERVKSRNHQCLFTYLCVKHPELELNWDFFEKVRTKRNGINYYGTPVTERDWKEAALEFQLNIDLFKRKIKEQLEKVIS